MHLFSRSGRSRNAFTSEKESAINVQEIQQHQRIKRGQEPTERHSPEPEGASVSRTDDVQQVLGAATWHPF